MMTYYMLSYFTLMIFEELIGPARFGIAKELLYSLGQKYGSLECQTEIDDNVGKNNLS